MKRRKVAPVGLAASVALLGLGAAVLVTRGEDPAAAAGGEPATGGRRSDGRAGGCPFSSRAVKHPGPHSSDQRADATAPEAINGR